MSKDNVLKWVYGLAGPLLSLIAFVVTYFIDPLNFGSRKPLAVLPAFLLSILILLLNHHLSINKEIQRNSKFTDRIYDAIKNHLHVSQLGSPERAMEYIINRIPILREVQNTSFNLKNEQERADEKLYETDSYKKIMKQLSIYCSKDMIWKDIGDHQALNRFREIYSSSMNVSKKKKCFYKYKILENIEPQINFIILEYKDGNREVLFNWDFRSHGQDPTVLLSRDNNIIEMFTVQFSHLWLRGSLDHDNSATKSTSKK